MTCLIKRATWELLFFRRMVVILGRKQCNPRQLLFKTTLPRQFGVLVGEESGMPKEVPKHPRRDFEVIAEVSTTLN